eukprot:17735-Heterococcus_DN1.PRE.2
MSHFAAGVALARSGHAVAATLVLAVAHTTCGWLAHDYMHGSSDSSKRVSVTEVLCDSYYQWFILLALCEEGCIARCLFRLWVSICRQSDTAVELLQADLTAD